MNKPKKPSKKIEIENGKIFYFDCSSKKVSLQSFLDWIKETLPKGSFDVTIELDEEPCYCEDEVCCGSGITNLVVGWKQKVNNDCYDDDMKKYKKKLVKWRNQID